MNQFVAKNFKGDIVIWGIVLVLTLISMLSVYSSAGSLSWASGTDNPFAPIAKHITLLGVGITMMWVFHKIHYKHYFKLAKYGAIIIVPVLLYATLRHTRWVFGIQPSEVMKYITIIYIAHILHQFNNKEISVADTILRILIPVGVVVLVIFPENLSMALLICFNTLLLLFVGRFPARGWIAIIIIIAGILVLGFLAYKAFPDFKFFHRISVWQERINGTESYQKDLSIKAIANGILPQGPGRSELKYFLPQANCDFIYAIIVEEGSIVLGAFIIFCYLVLFFRAGLISQKSDEIFPGLLAIGIVGGMVIQSFLHMFVAIGLGPVTGQTLPFVSMGGTSLIITGSAIGMVLSTSYFSTKPTAVHVETEPSVIGDGVSKQVVFTEHDDFYNNTDSDELMKHDIDDLD